MKVTLYTTHCPKCSVLEQKLNLASIPFDTIEGQAAIDDMMAAGFMSAPMLQVDDKCMDFSEAVKWVNANDQSANESCDKCNI